MIYRFLMADGIFKALLDFLLGVDLDPNVETANFPTVMTRYWKEHKFPLHECVDLPDLPCLACLAAASRRRRKA